jgi:hypothetical protein
MGLRLQCQPAAAGLGLDSTVASHRQPGRSDFHRAENPGGYCNNFRQLCCPQGRLKMETKPVTNWLLSARRDFRGSKTSR